MKHEKRAFVIGMYGGSYALENIIQGYLANEVSFSLRSFSSDRWWN